jgi:hypothetical protein
MQIDDFLARQHKDLSVSDLVLSATAPSAQTFKPPLHFIGVIRLDQ